MKHCDHCDVAYCTKCGKEWGNDGGQTIKIQKDPWPYTPYPFNRGDGIVLCVADPVRLTQVHAHGT